MSMFTAIENVKGPYCASERRWLAGVHLRLVESVAGLMGNDAMKKEARTQRHSMAKQQQQEAAAAAKLPTKFMTVDGKKIAYYDSGVGSPVVVVNSTTKDMGLELHKQIAKFTRVITFDHAGLGESTVADPKPKKRRRKKEKQSQASADHSVEAMSKELAGVLRGARVSSDVVLVGTYVNWMSTLLCARKNADYVAGVVIAEPIVPDRRDDGGLSDAQFMERCLNGTKWWAALLLAPVNGAVDLATQLFGNHPHMLNPGARGRRDLSAPDALVERTFVEALYHKDARKRFMLRHCTPSAGRLATSVMLRGAGDPRWQALCMEAQGMEKAFNVESAKGRTITPLMFGPYVPATVPVTIVASDFDQPGVAKAAKQQRNLFDYFSRPWDVLLPGMHLRVMLPPSIRELNLRMRLCRYGLLRNHALQTLLPHAKFVTFTPTRLGPTDANSSALDVTDLDSRSIASEVKKFVKQHRELVASGQKA